MPIHDGAGSAGKLASARGSVCLFPPTSTIGLLTAPRQPESYLGPIPSVIFFDVSEFARTERLFFSSDFRGTLFSQKGKMEMTMIVTGSFLKEIISALAN